MNEEKIRKACCLQERVVVHKHTVQYEQYSRLTVRMIGGYDGMPQEQRSPAYPPILKLLHMKVSVINGIYTGLYISLSRLSNQIIEKIPSQLPIIQQ